MAVRRQTGTPLVLGLRYARRFLILDQAALVVHKGAVVLACGRPSRLPTLLGRVVRACTTAALPLLEAFALALRRKRLACAAIVAWSLYAYTAIFILHSHCLYLLLEELLSRLVLYR